MYTSKYTSRKIRFSQYVAEVMSERLAKKNNRKLEDHFWNNKEWSAFFKRQNLLANNLLKTYSEGAIIQGIKNVSWAYSLATQALIKEIERIHNLKPKEEVEQPETTQRVEEKPKSIMDLI